MIYLRRYWLTEDKKLNADIAICEATEKAARYEADGYEQCTRDGLKHAWRLRDRRTLDAMRAAVPLVETAPLVRAVGHVI